MSYCGELTFAGVADWRLPSIYELETLVDDRVEVGACIDVTFFPNAAAASYWTSTPAPADGRYGWAVGFGEADSLCWRLNGHKRARCVRTP